MADRVEEHVRLLQDALDDGSYVDYAPPARLMLELVNTPSQEALDAMVRLMAALRAHIDEFPQDTTKKFFAGWMSNPEVKDFHAVSLVEQNWKGWTPAIYARSKHITLLGAVQMDAAELARRQADGRGPYDAKDWDREAAQPQIAILPENCSVTDAAYGMIAAQTSETGRQLLSQVNPQEYAATNWTQFLNHSEPSLELIRELAGRPVTEHHARFFEIVGSHESASFGLAMLRQLLSFVSFDDLIKDDVVSSDDLGSILAMMFIQGMGADEFWGILDRLQVVRRTDKGWEFSDWMDERCVSSFTDGVHGTYRSRGGGDWFDDFPEIARELNLPARLTVKQLFALGRLEPQHLFENLLWGEHGDFDYWSPVNYKGEDMNYFSRQRWLEEFHNLGSLHAWLKKVHPTLVGMPPAWIWEALATPEVKAELSQMRPGFESSKSYAKKTLKKVVVWDI